MTLRASPPRLRTVAARPDHHPDFVRFFRELAVPDPVPDRDRWAAEIAPSAFFLERDGRLVAYAFLEAFGERGYLRHAVVAAEARGEGVGLALMAVCAARLRAGGCTRWELNVREDNVPARRLYARCGLGVAHRSHVLRLAWDAVATLPAAPEDVFARAVEPGDDGTVEDAFRLPAGMVARLRGLRGAVVLQLVHGGLPVAFARFDPAFPGCFPFRVQAPGLARPLLDALRAHARPGDRWLQLVVEDDEATAETLRAAGAAEVSTMLHLDGPLPAAP